MDLLIKNVRIITGDVSAMDAGTGNIGINEGFIEYIGTDAKEAARIIDGRGMVAMPGLVNAHTHSPMVLMRNLVTDKPLEKWLEDGIFPIEGRLTREHITNGSMLAAAEMIKSGTTSFLDMYFEVGATADVAIESGMKANISLGLLTAHEMDSDLSKAKAVWNNYNAKYKGAGEGRINTSIEVHSVYLYEEKGLRDSAEFAMESGTSIHSHLHETKTEVMNCKAKYGMSPIKVFQKFGLLDVPVTAAHTVWLEDEDIGIIAERGVHPVHCPSSNMFLGSGFAPVQKMLDKGIPVCLGTDGAASNNDMDMLGEMALAGLIHKGKDLNPTVMTPEDIICMATVNGAKALGFDNTGCIKVGMDADIILVNMDTLHNTPMPDPVHALI